MCRWCQPHQSQERTDATKITNVVKRCTRDRIDLIRENKMRIKNSETQKRNSAEKFKNLLEL